MILKFLILLLDLPIIDDKFPNEPILFLIETFILAIKFSFFDAILSQETFNILDFLTLIFLNLHKYLGVL